MPALFDAAGCTLHLPTHIGDYTDFFAGIHHARATGAMFRPDEPLTPCYLHLPIAYHGRASSVRASGHRVRRPSGQVLDARGRPTFGPTRALDFECEMAVWVAGENALGEPTPLAEAGSRVAGLGLLNDWSARDLQRWEARPLGPFLAKSFHSTVSPWVVTAEALAPFRAPQPPRADGDPAPLPYLWDASDQRHGAIAVDLEAHLSTAAMRDQGLPPHRLSRGNSASNMYWTVAQIVAHQSSNGCNLQSGDLIGTGTLSSADEGGLGSLLEITHGGTRPIRLPSGETRTFLEDGDEIALSAFARADGHIPIGFGECRARIVSAPDR